MMRCIYFVALIVFIRHISSQYMAMNSPLNPPCDSSAKNALIEHFFNLIFSEFHSTPPVCVCVQMCVGQSTYCYPNGCLQRGEIAGVDSPQYASSNTALGVSSQHLFVVDQNNDFMTNYFERNTAEETKTVRPARELISDMHPDIFKDLYNMLTKNKKIPSLKIRYNLREQVKNIKSDLLRIDTKDVSKTRWPMNRRNVNGKISGKPDFFVSMLPANVAPKYFKRDISKTIGGDGMKSYNLFENSNNATESTGTETAMSLENLINYLIKTRATTRYDETDNETKPNSIDKQSQDNKVIGERKVNDVNHTDAHASSETVNDLVINSKTMRNDNNIFLNDIVSPRTKMLSEMILNLSKRIEMQNNTSMEIVKRVVSDFDEEDTTPDINTELLKSELRANFTENVTMETNDAYSIDQETKETTPADFKKTMVTKKNRQRRARKSQYSKINTQ